MVNLNIVEKLKQGLNTCEKENPTLVSSYIFLPRITLEQCIKLGDDMMGLKKD